MTAYIHHDGAISMGFNNRPGILSPGTGLRVENVT